MIAGGSGFLGVSLARHLTECGAEVVILSRRKPAQGAWKHVVWDARTLGEWAACLDGAAGVVNLVGRSVDCVKTPEHCDEILRSRVEATRVLGMAMRKIQETGGVPPPVWVQMSTAHIYGDPLEVRCEEDSPPGYGLAPTVGKAWEEAFNAGLLASQRGVVLRTSFVVGKPNEGGTGALGKLGFLARVGLGGTVGSGRQGISWIHALDMNRIFERGLTDASMRGMYVATAPSPVNNREFMKELRGAAGGLGGLGIGLPAFSWMVKLGAPLVMRTDPDLALCGRFVVPTRLLAEGFEFRYPEVRGALGEIYSTGSGKG